LLFVGEGFCSQRIAGKVGTFDSFQTEICTADGYSIDCGTCKEYKAATTLIEQLVIRH